MFEDLKDLENFVRSEEYKQTKKDILMFNANLKMKRNFSDILELKAQITEYFEGLKENNYRMYIVFSLNKKILDDEINLKINN
ncbi:hypothetical protein KO317_02525 [Candidatus Micrarchaeota archaeon]|nr:hypothetical protein [Candidatus Micrarchaeota archaeon]